MKTWARLLFLSSVSLAISCSEGEVPGFRDQGGRDLGFPDFGLGDGGVPGDTGVVPDGGVNPDVGADAGSTDMGGAPDTGIPQDTGVIADIGPADTGIPADTGVIVPDADGDNISDADEGDGQVDTDNDGTPDTLDTDSDGDGINDIDEAGDADPATAPIDTDGDGTPDFRDTDSDGDGIDDAVEGNGDTDGDGNPDFQDTDSDGDGIPDADEGAGDTDGDGIPDYLDDDTDGDGIPDAVEGAGDPDNDSVPNYLDDDSDGDTILDSIEGVFDPDRDNIPAFLDTDSDGDGIDDAIELTADPDNDGTGNWLDSDSDGDTIRDDHDGVGDPDNDNTPNYLDTDSDGDGILDADEAGDAVVATPPFDNDFDTVPNFLDLDSDNDTIQDGHEGSGDTDNNGIIDRLDIDSDGDSILDNVEAGDADLNTVPVDSDNDGTPDFQDLDADNDTILDLTEGALDPDNDNIPNFQDPDSDNDSWTDAIEAGDADLATPPVDTDADNTPDYLDVDSDADGLGDIAEPGCPAGPNRLTEDSDNDSFVDPAEIAFGSDPCNGASIIDDFYFILPPGGPGDDDTLVFSDTNIDSADIAINMDTTGSMGGEITEVQNSLSTTIIPGVGNPAVIPNAAFAVTRFEDFPIEPFGCPIGSTDNACSAISGDVPFALGSRVTTDSAAAQTAVNALAVSNGYDFPESGIESLYQIATGFGVSYTGGAVAPFNPAQNLVPGVADGTIGGVGFRDDSLPIIVHITDAFSHERDQYLAVDPAIGAANTQTVQTALDTIGARVVSIANSRLPNDPFTAICSGSTPTILGRIDSPAGTDADWFELQGVSAGDSVDVEAFAVRIGASLDTMIGVFDDNTLIGFNDDAVGFDSELTNVILTGAGPWYVAISAWDDPNFDGAGGTTADVYFLDVVVNGTPFTPSVMQCRIDDANSQVGATPLVNFGAASLPPDITTCVVNCGSVLEPFTLPWGMADATGASVPACAWDLFGGGRPATCGAAECCTGLGGNGRPPNANGLCPLTFEIDDNGAGLGNTMVAGIEALVRFSTFTITTVVRTDPAAAIDTTCFIESVIPLNATPPNTCAPIPVAVDLFAPAGQNDSWENVVPGTVLEFDVNAINLDSGTGQPCANSTPDPQLFRAFIDVVADGVTVVDTRDVIIIVPPLPPGGSN